LKKFTVPCDFAGAKAPFSIYVGDPHPDRHPLHHQSSWLRRERGGNIPPELMESVERLRGISVENGVSFEELCVAALGTVQDDAAPADPADESGQA
jgi:hypothetical protein